MADMVCMPRRRQNWMNIRQRLSKQLCRGNHSIDGFHPGTLPSSDDHELKKKTKCFGKNSCWSALLSLPEMKETIQADAIPTKTPCEVMLRCSCTAFDSSSRLLRFDSPSGLANVGFEELRVRTHGESRGSTVRGILDAIDVYQVLF